MRLEYWLNITWQCDCWTLILIYYYAHSVTCVLFSFQISRFKVFGFIFWLFVLCYSTYSERKECNFVCGGKQQIACRPVQEDLFVNCNMRYACTAGDATLFIVYILSRLLHTYLCLWRYYALAGLCVSTNGYCSIIASQGFTVWVSQSHYLVNEVCKRGGKLIVQFDLSPSV